MDFKCLMKLLLEKEIIKQTEECKLNDKQILLVYKYEYQEVGEKILNDFKKLDNQKHLHIECNESKKEIQLINIDNLTELIMKDRENYEKFFWNPYRFKDGQIGSLRPIKYEVLLRIVKNIKGLTVCRGYGEGGTITIINNYIRDKRLKEEEQKKEEVLNFINSLP